MAIYKSKHASNYTVLPNEVFKSKLSIEAIGLLAYFLSLPSDWVIYKTTLHEQLNVGRDKLNTVFNELRDAGYLISVEKREAGKISYEHIVYDKPFNGEPLTEKPFTENPLTVKPSTENTPLLNTNKQSTNKQNKNIQIPHIDEFVAYAISLNPNIDTMDVRLKYNSWLENDWKTGKDKPIKKWKSVLSNTIPYLKTKTQTQSKPVREL